MSINAQVNCTYSLTVVEQLESGEIAAINTYVAPLDALIVRVSKGLPTDKAPPTDAPWSCTHSLNDGGTVNLRLTVHGS